MFEMTLQVREADIDELGHLNNVRYVQWVQDVAVAHSAHVGLDVPTYRELGAFFVLRRHEAEYLRSVPLGATLTARTWISSKKAVQVVREMDFLLDGEAVFKSTTLWAFVDLVRARVVRIPPRVAEAFAADLIGPDGREASGR